MFSVWGVGGGIPPMEWPYIDSESAAIGYAAAFNGIALGGRRYFVLDRETAAECLENLFHAYGGYPPFVPG